jgi:ABC-type transport system substrate-binding protein
LRYIAVQFKTEFTAPREILDVRVRRGLAHAFEKQALVDGLLGGEGQWADTMVAPTGS